MIVFETWFWLFINEALWIMFTFSCFITEDFNLERVICVQNLTTWVKCTLAVIYNQLPKISYTQKMILC